jgi:thiosulfate/3-mercaptopyruvate sulfurtransferase
VTAPLPPFVSPEWLEQHPDAVVADTRWYLDGRSGEQAYRDAQLPGAVFVDLDRWLSGPPAQGGGRHPLPTPEVFAEGMCQLGIGDDSTVIAYDDAGGVIAARLVWMLRVLGRRAAVLEGGMAAFTGSLEATPDRPARAHFTVTPWPAGRLAAVEDMSAGRALMLDARNPDRFRGEFEPVDPRAGHIPGAVNVPCRANLTQDGALVGAETILRRYTDAGVRSGADVIAYCGSGVTACHNLLTLELVGFDHGRLYPGSWSEYSRFDDRPVTVVRPATPADVDDIEQIVTAAFSAYIDRIGRPPAPMTLDYRAMVTATDHVEVLATDGSVAGVLVTAAEPDHLFLDTVAVAPWAQGHGYGRTLLAHAEQRAREQGLREVRLYTNAAMTENLRLYPHLGYTEVDRRTVDGFHRVHFVKTLTH